MMTKDSDFDLKQKLITNCELTESLFDDATLVPKKCVDDKIKNIDVNVDTSELMKKKSDSDLDMNNKEIKNVRIATMQNLSVTRKPVMAAAIVYHDQNLTDYDVVNKLYLDSRIQNINDLLKIDGTNKMTADLDLGNNQIVNLKEPTESESGAAVNVSFVNKMKESILTDATTPHRKSFSKIFT